MITSSLGVVFSKDLEKLFVLELCKLVIYKLYQYWWLHGAPGFESHHVNLSRQSFRIPPSVPFVRNCVVSLVWCCILGTGGVNYFSKDLEKQFVRKHLFILFRNLQNWTRFWEYHPLPFVLHCVVSLVWCITWDWRKYSSSVLLCILS